MFSRILQAQPTSSPPSTLNLQLHLHVNIPHRGEHSYRDVEQDVEVDEDADHQHPLEDGHADGSSHHDYQVEG